MEGRTMGELLDRAGEHVFLLIGNRLWRLWYRANQASLWFWRRRNARRGRRCELAPPF
jgi:hypothetical protein